uniref:Uncharacterized protein n=1 Tax=Cannabis sativa TaxID=3483 RepID=A0A803QN46_CANSA
MEKDVRGDASNQIEWIDERVDKATDGIVKANVNAVLALEYRDADRAVWSAKVNVIADLYESFPGGIGFRVSREYPGIKADYLGVTRGIFWLLLERAVVKLESEKPRNHRMRQGKMSQCKGQEILGGFGFQTPKHRSLSSLQRLVYLLAHKRSRVQNRKGKIKANGQASRTVY